MKLRLTVLFLFFSILSYSQKLRNENETWKLANSLYEDIISQKYNFAIIASLYSEDPETAKKGGDIGWTSRGMLVPEYENLAWTLPIGAVSKPFKLN